MIFVDGFAVTNVTYGVAQRTQVLAIPIPSNSTSPYTITQPGTYRLTDDMTDFQIITTTSDVAIVFNGFAINNPTEAAPAITIGAGLDNVIIKGGSIVGNNVSGSSGILINDNCSNVYVNEIKILNEYYGVQILAGTGNNNILIKENNISNCDFGVYASNSSNLKIRQNFISCPTYTPVSETTGIYLNNTEGTLIDFCTISSLNKGIEVYNSTATKIRNSSLLYLTEIQPERAGIYLTLGAANIIENCLLSSLVTNVNGGLYGIVLADENMSLVTDCKVNYIGEQESPTMHSIGISVVRTNTAQNNCIVQNSVVSSLDATDVTTASYGFGLLDTTATPTNANFINNVAIDCLDPVFSVTAYSPNIINVAANPQTDDYLWNWILQDTFCS